MLILFIFYVNLNTFLTNYMKMKLSILLLSFIWSNPINNQALSTIGLHEQIIQTYENGSPLEVHFFDAFGHKLQIKQKRYYYQNGSIKSIGYYLMDNKVIWKYYDEGNNIIQEETIQKEEPIMEEIKYMEEPKKLDDDIKALDTKDEVVQIKSNIEDDLANTNDINDINENLLENDVPNKKIQEEMTDENDDDSQNMTNDFHEEKKQIISKISGIEKSMEDLDNDVYDVVGVLFEEQKGLLEKITNLEKQIEELETNHVTNINRSQWSDSNNRFMPNSNKRDDQKPKKWYQYFAFKMYHYQDQFSIIPKISFNAKYPVKWLKLYQIGRNSNKSFEFNFEYAPVFSYENETTQLLSGIIQFDLPYNLNIIKWNFNTSMKVGIVSLPDLENNIHIIISPELNVELPLKNKIISTSGFVAPEILSSIGGESKNLSMGFNIGLKINLD